MPVVATTITTTKAITTTPIFHKDGVPYVVDGVLVLPPKYDKKLPKRTTACDKEKDIPADTAVIICFYRCMAVDTDISLSKEGFKFYRLFNILGGLPFK